MSRRKGKEKQINRAGFNHILHKTQKIWVQKENKNKNRYQERKEAISKRHKCSDILIERNGRKQRGRESCIW